MNVKASSNLRQQDLNRQLLLAAASLRLTDIRRALRDGADPNAIGEDGRNALLVLGCVPAVHQEDDFVFARSRLLSQALKCVETLLGAGARIDAKAHDGSTLLHNPFVMRMLPDWVGKWTQELDVHAANAEGVAPAHICAGFGLESSARHLSAAGVNWLCTTHDGRTTLHFAARYRNMPMTLWLMDRGMRLSDKDASGRSALLSTLMSCSAYDLPGFAAAALRSGEPLPMHDIKEWMARRLSLLGRSGVALLSAANLYLRALEQGEQPCPQTALRLFRAIGASLVHQPRAEQAWLAMRNLLAGISPLSDHPQETFSAMRSIVADKLVAQQETHEILSLLVQHGAAVREYQMVALEGAARASGKDALCLAPLYAVCAHDELLDLDALNGPAPLERPN